MNTTTKVFLAIDSETLSAMELQKIMGTSPDDGWSVGDVYRIAGKERLSKFSRWSAIEHAYSTSEIEDATDRLVARLTLLEPNIYSLPKGLRVALSICVDHDNTVFGIGLSASAVAFLARVGAELDISIVVSSTPS